MGSDDDTKRPGRRPPSHRTLTTRPIPPKWSRRLPASRERTTTATDFMSRASTLLSSVASTPSAQTPRSSRSRVSIPPGRPLLPRQEDRIRVPGQEGDPWHQDPCHLGQGRKATRQLWRGEGALQAQPPPEELGRYGACHALPILDIDNPSTSIRRGGGRQCSEERRSEGCSEQIDHLFVVW